MDGQFLVRQIYEDEITYNLVGAAVEVLSEFLLLFLREIKKILITKRKTWRKS
jgi:hypothetical protein